jgi:KEOPS complex subunit Cgi121
MKDAEMSAVEVWARPTSRGGAKALMERALEEASHSGSEILVMDGDKVFGSAHVRSAVLHASKAIAEGRNSSDSLAMETLLYASGERQLSSAIRKMSVGPATERVVLAVVRGRFVPGEGWSRLPDAESRIERARLARFGITEREMSTVAEGRLSELVLEKVAAVDVIKK